MDRFGCDDTNGIVIGNVFIGNHYVFYGLDGKAIMSDNYDNDKEAISDFKKKHPSKFKDGVEMRVFD